MLEALAERPDIHLVIGGGGVLSRQIEQESREHPNIHFLGFVNHKLIPRYTIASDVVYYGFNVDHPNARYSAPNKLFEALAAGLGVISADFGEIGRIVRENDCGILLEDFSKERILKALTLCGDPERLNRWKQNSELIGRTNYNWSHAEASLLDAYRTLLGPAARTLVSVSQVDHIRTSGSAE